MAPAKICSTHLHTPILTYQAFVFEPSLCSLGLQAQKPHQSGTIGYQYSLKGWSRSIFSNKQISNPAISTTTRKTQINQSINLSNNFLHHKAWDTLVVVLQIYRCILSERLQTELNFTFLLGSLKIVGASLPTELHMYMNNGGTAETKRRPCVQQCNTMYNCDQ